jgi:beta-galactosidase
MKPVLVFCLIYTLLAGQLLRGAHPRAQSRNAASTSYFPVAVWYGGGKARAPMLEPLDSTSAARWGKDLDKIKATGFNTIKCWVDWATAEPTAGVFDFSHLNLLMKLASERGLRVIVQIYTDSAPDWVGARYPDGRFVDRSGAVITSQSAPGFCIDHAGVRREMETFLRALSSDANRFPALYAWDVWSEPHVINWADFPYLSNPEFCFCPSSQQRFRVWLRARYHTLDALNTAWYRRFQSWDQVQPPRFPTILSYTDYLDWRAFISDKLAADLKTRVDAIRGQDAGHAITSHAAAPGLFTSPMDGYGEPDDWKMSANADFFGTSLYPKHSESTRPWSRLMLAAGLDFTRSAGLDSHKAFWIGELQAGQGATGMRIAQPVDSHDEEYWMWQVIAHGAREIAVYAWYPMNSGFESNGYGLIQLDGSLTPRAHAAGNTASLIQANAQGLNSARPASAQVAVLYDRLSYMVGGTQQTLSKLGNAERDSLMGVYRAFYEKQIPVDFIHADLFQNHPSNPYRIIFLPYAVMLSRSFASKIKDFVANGGTAVAEARLAWNDARGYASPVIPGFGLDQVFGARETLIRPDPRPRLIIQPAAHLEGLNAGDSVAGAAFEEDLQPQAQAQVLARFANGEAAMVQNSFGKGRAVLIGSFAGLAYDRQPDPSTARLLLSLAKAAGVTAEVQVSDPSAADVEVRRLVSSRSQYIFVFNHAAQPADSTLSIRLPWKAGACHDLVTHQAVDFETAGEHVVLRKKLGAKDIWILRLDKQ